MNSMTAFGRARQTRAGKDITVEIKSVNNRYLDFSARIPRSYTFLEEKIKPRLMTAGVSRGKIEVYVGVDTVDSPGLTVTVDETYAASYLAALRRLRDTFRLPDDISTMRLAANRELFTIHAPEEDADAMWSELSVVLDEALAQFCAGRAAEGARLEADITAKLDGVSAMVDRIEQLSAEDISSYRERLETKLRNVLADNRITIDEGRILTECAIFADRVAIDEELVRLRSHFAAFREICASPEPVGRKLDFLMQELNREANTIGSKCSNSEIAHLVVAVKSEFEKIREQIQNIE